VGLSNGERPVTKTSKPIFTYNNMRYSQKCRHTFETDNFQLV